MAAGVAAERGSVLDRDLRSAQGRDRRGPLPAVSRRAAPPRPATSRDRRGRPRRCRRLCRGRHRRPDHREPRRHPVPPPERHRSGDRGHDGRRSPSACARETGLPLGINVLANAADHGAGGRQGGRGAHSSASTSGPTPMSPTRDWSRAMRPSPCATAPRSPPRTWRSSPTATSSTVRMPSPPTAPSRELTRDLEFFDADAVIATGQRTGDAATADEIRTVKARDHPAGAGRLRRSRRTMSARSWRWPTA